ncbi:MAG: redox-sensing transcriptional repressor Rex [Gaiellaceae bacterium]
MATRLSRYLQVASRAAKQGSTRISSAQIAAYTGINATQVRRDLSSFGKFGKRGSGYEIDLLCESIRGILGVREEKPIVIVGAGRVGEALASSELFAGHEIEIAAIFDIDPEKIGRSQGGLIVSSAAELAADVRRRKVVAGVIAVPAEAAQSVADELVRAGVSVLFNYSEALLDVPENVVVQTLNPAVELLSRLSSQAG